MKLAFERAALLKALAHVQSVVERRTTIPILSNVKLEAGENGISLTATDMDLSVVEATEAEVIRAGATTAPAHTLYDVVRSFRMAARSSWNGANRAPSSAFAPGAPPSTCPACPRPTFRR